MSLLKLNITFLKAKHVLFCEIKPKNYQKIRISLKNEKLYIGNFLKKVDLTHVHLIRAKSKEQNDILLLCVKQMVQNLGHFQFTF